MNDLKNNKRNYTVPPLPNTIWQNPLHFIAFGFGAGALPKAPGTFGTLIAIPFYLVLAQYSIGTYSLILIALTLISMWICDRVSRDIQVKDHQGMCLDEIIGFLFAMMFASVSWINITIGFILFRWFDIWKPWPIRLADQTIGGGIGMILDDILAGIYAAALLYLINLGSHYVTITHTII